MVAQRDAWQHDIRQHDGHGSTGEQLLEIVTADSDILCFGGSMAVSADGARVGAEAYGGYAFSGSSCVLDRTTDVQLLKLERQRRVQWTCSAGR